MAAVTESPSQWKNTKGLSISPNGPFDVLFPAPTAQVRALQAPGPHLEGAG